uniref:Uncharacterized protein n=1 Tax=Panagrolaimus sp. PS1159 TaxID=55785 RepID=A0AC35F8W3_9BILA
MLSSINSKILSTSTLQKLHLLRTINKFAAAQPTPQYKPLPCSGDFNLDFRKDRKVIEDGYKLEGMDLQLRLELLDENDYEFMTQYVTEHFVKNSNIVKHLNIKGEEWIELIHPLVVQWISCKNSVLAKKDGDKIIGAGFGSTHDRQEFNDLYRGQLFHDNPKFVIKKDYGE